MSLLLASGHPHARRYPIGFVFDEAMLAVERENGRIASELLGWRSAYVSAKVKDGQRPFDDLINDLTNQGDDEPEQLRHPDPAHPVNQ